MNSISKNLLFLILVLLSQVRVHSQNRVLDSLRNELSIVTQRDSNRVKLLNRFAFKNYGVNQDSLKQYSIAARALAKEIHFLNGQARSWYLQSIFYLAKGDLDSAQWAINSSLALYEKDQSIIGMYSCYDLKGTISRFKEEYDASLSHYNKSLKIAKDRKDHPKIATIIANMGSVYSQKGELDKAIATYQKSIDIYDSLNAKKAILTPMGNIALVLARQNRYSESLAYFQKCLLAYRENGNKVSGSSILLNMGLVYIGMDKHDKALPYIKESLAISKELGNKSAISKNITNLGIIYQAKNDLEKALKCFNEALTMSEEIGSKEGQFASYTNIGDIYLQRNNPDSALSFFKKALEVSSDLGGKREIAQSYIAVGAAYHALDLNNQAMGYVETGLKIADQLSLLKYRMEGNLLLSQINEALGNNKTALEKHKLFKKLSDELLNNKSDKEITRLEYDYKYKQKLDSANSRELRLTNQVNSTALELEKSQRNLLLGVIAFLLLAVILGIIIFLQKLKNERSKIQNIAVEQKLLRSQMTPHFIFNSLSVLQGMILNKEDQKSVSYLSKFSKLLRISLENSRDKIVPVAQELSAVENYLTLQNIESNHPLDYSIVVDDSLDLSSLRIPPMLIQPFIENAIEHAFENDMKDRKINVHLSYSNYELICKITDNGIGINKQKTNQSQDKNHWQLP